MQYADIGVNPLGKSLGEDVYNRYNDEEGEKDDRRRDHDAADQRMARRGRVPGRSGRLSLGRQRIRHEPVLVSRMRSMRVGTARIASRRPFATARPPLEAIDREQHKEREE